jgi:hypothetical protein
VSRVDRVKHSEARLLLARASRQRRMGDPEGAVRSAAEALACLLWSHPEVLSAVRLSASPPALQAASASVAMPGAGAAGSASPAALQTSARDADDCLAFVLNLALELRV